MATKNGESPPHLLPAEVTLLDYAADDSRDVMTLSDKEALVLQLANQIHEQQLEKALLEQGTVYRTGKFLCCFFIFESLFPLTDPLIEPESLSGDDAEEQLAMAEREFMEARATYTVRRKATRTILMTDPILKAVHLKATTPPERFVFPGLVGKCPAPYETRTGHFFA